LVFDDFDYRRRLRKHPLLSQFSSTLPSNIKELFQWMEFIVANNPIAAAGIKKLSEVPVTTLRYSSGDDVTEGSFSDHDSWKTILEDDLNIKATLLNISYNTHLYGNCFVSVYAPIVRLIVCEECGHRHNIRNAKKLKIFLGKKDVSASTEEEFHDKATGDYSKVYKKSSDDTKKVRAKAVCPQCRMIRVHHFKDVPVRKKDDINIVIWNPNNIRISGNPFSGEEEIYYDIPADLKKAIKENDPFVLSTTPIAIIESSLSNKVFKFAKGSIFHMKKESISGVSTSWGLPALTSAIPSILTLMVLRKANEKIASDYMVPLRVIFPSQQSNPSEMFNYMGGSDFVSKIKRMIEQWKIDPSGVQMTPFPVGTETILGDGKLLTLNAEIEQLEANIANSLGIPIEFIKGGLSYTSQGSSLRLLENQLAKITAGLDDVLGFIVNKVGAILNKEPVSIKLIPFKIIDDLQEKAAIMQLAASGQGIISKATILEMFNIDSNAEQDRAKEEQKMGVKAQMELQNYQQEVATSLEERAKQKEQMNTGSFEMLNQQALMQEAQNYASQLAQMDPGMRKSKLDEMAKTNYIMYGVVKALLEMQDRKQAYAATQGAAQGGQSPQ